jgi:hypothetical protein
MGKNAGFEELGSFQTTDFDSPSGMATLHTKYLFVILLTLAVSHSSLYFLLS